LGKSSEVGKGGGLKDGEGGRKILQEEWDGRRVGMEGEGWKKVFT